MTRTALLGAWGLALAGFTAVTTRAASDPREFTLPLSVRGLPREASGVPVSLTVDFSRILEDREVPGAVDERSLRLFLIPTDGEVTEKPVQFSPSPEPRAEKRRFLEGTVDGVSYITEHEAGVTPPVPRVRGVLTWLAERPGDREVRYLLRFAVPREGRMVQVPYPPSNLRHFDAKGRASALPSFPRMQIRPQWPLEGKLQVLDGRQLVTTYHVGPSTDPRIDTAASVRRPFFYPLNGPEGTSLTELGKPHDPTGSHAHHYSFWIAHSDVGGRDFWSEKGGTIEHEALEHLEDGPVFCRIVQRTRWVAEGKTRLRGRRTFTLYRSGDGHRLVDVTLELRPPGEEPVILGETTFGFLSARVAQSLTVFDGGGEIRTSRGQRNEQQAHRQRAAWLDQAGPVREGVWNGVAILEHPSNPRHPTVWHCRNDGWACASFNGAGPWTLEPHKPLALRYRVVLHRGDADAGQVAKHHAAYAAETQVKPGEAREGGPPGLSP